MSLVSGWFPYTLTAAALGLVVLAGWLLLRTDRRRVLVAAVAAVVLFAVVAIGQLAFSWIDYLFPAVYYAWAVPTAVAGGLLLAACVPLPAGGHSPRWHRRALSVTSAVVAVPLALTLLAVQVNIGFGYFPTWSSLQGDVGRPPDTLAAVLARRAAAGSTDADAHWLSRTAGSATQPGLVTQLAIPGTRSGFAARKAWLWLPPAFVDTRIDRFPVIMLLSGSPGTPADWLRSGGAAQIGDAYAAAHGGLAPILVMPDINGRPTVDSECVNSYHGNIETYLSQDVPAFVTAALGIRAQRWAIAGLSEGGMCAAMLALRHPDRFDAFADFSGLTSPSIDNTVEVRPTTRNLFGGRLSEYDEHDPLWLLTHHPAPLDFAVFACGGGDPADVRATATLAGLARRAGLPTTVDIIPGRGHNYYLWHRVLSDSFGQLATADPATGRPALRPTRRAAPARPAPGRRTSVRARSRAA